MGGGLGDKRREHAHHDADEKSAQGHGEEGDNAEGDVNRRYGEAVVLHLGKDVHHIVKYEGDPV